MRKPEPTLTIRVETASATTDYKVSQALAKLADLTGCRVVAEYCDVDMIADPGVHPESVLSDWMQERGYNENIGEW